MSYSLKIKQRSINLRKKGFSIKEIAKKLKIANSTSSMWLGNIQLNAVAKQRLKKRQLLHYYKMSQHWQQKRINQLEIAKKQARIIVDSISLSTSNLKFLCSFLFWAEGAKNFQQIKFINSDPNMIKVFLFLLRKSFPIDEKKFRALIHIHEYHNEKSLKKYWSEITKIPQKQFYKSYLKPHTKKRKRLNYKGSINISYYDAKLARELYAIYNTLTDKILGV
ncbi:hypothetical protein L6272_06490 [Microgenomates group bacterium]|nr:hypothetical protein [Microgenomates group bacterium]